MLCSRKLVEKSNLIAFIGSILLGICSIPELIRTVRDSHCYIGWGMMLTWYLGEILVAIHVYRKHKDFVLLMNYCLNIVIISILLAYKILDK